METERWNYRRVVTRDVTELLGVVKGIMFDGVVTAAEVDSLARWIEDHPHILDEWPTGPIVDRLRRVLADGVVAPEEQADLAELFNGLVAGGLEVVGDDARIASSADLATALPIETPSTPIHLPGLRVVLTGKFAYGSRSACAAATTTMGALVVDTVTRETDLLVIGTFVSPSWKQSSFGRKIERAVELKAKHGRPLILGEDTWTGCLA